MHRRSFLHLILSMMLATVLVPALEPVGVTRADTGSGLGYAVDWTAWGTGTRLESRARPLKCAEIGASNPNPGVALSQWPCAGVNGSLGGPNQVWQNADTSTYTNLLFRNQASKHCLGKSGGLPAQVTCSHDAANTWTVVSTTSGYFRLRFSDGQCLNTPASPADGATLILGGCSTSSSEWKVRDGIALDLYGYTKHMQMIRPVVTPMSHFWSSTFSFVNQVAGGSDHTGGYAGLQTNSSQGYPKAAVFAIWGGSVGDQVASGGSCAGWDDNATVTGEGGYGMSCVVPYAWNDGGSYLLQIQFAGYGNGPQTYLSGGSMPGKYWIATVNGLQIARIFVPGAHRTGTTVHLLAARAGSFSEQFANFSACMPVGSLDATFDPPFTWNPGGRSAQDTDPTARIGPDARCTLQRQTWVWEPSNGSYGPVRMFVPDVF